MARASRGKIGNMLESVGRTLEQGGGATGRTRTRSTTSGTRAGTGRSLVRKFLR